MSERRRKCLASKRKFARERLEAINGKHAAFLDLDASSTAVPPVSKTESEPPAEIETPGVCHTCKRCSSEMVVLLNESRLGCMHCGLTSVYLQSTSSRIAFGEEVEFSVFSYKRHNHFLDWLAAFQAKESTVVGEDILGRVMDVLYKRRLRPQDITCDAVKEALRELKLSKYYDNTPQITARITGVLPPRMTPFQEQQVKLMFQAIQEPFRQHCPPVRRNFLSYSYVLYKFCELMGWDVFLKCFTLLKGKDKLKLQDEIFSKICRSLHWEC